MQTVTIHLGNGLERSMLYVACSRATSLEGLFLLGDFKPPNKPSKDHSPTIEMNRMRKEALLIPKFESLHFVPENIFQIISHNVQSLRRHILTIKNDSVFMKSDLILMQESWNLANETYELEHFSEVQRNKIFGLPTAKGTMIFANESQDVTTGTEKQFENEMGGHIELTTCKIADLNIINVYKNPKSSLTLFETAMETIKPLLEQPNVLVFGDFNEKLTQDSGTVNYFMKIFDLEMFSPYKPTTDAGTVIDGVFGRLVDYEIEIKIYEAYTSFHKPIVARIKNKEGSGLTQIFDNINF